MFEIKLDGIPAEINFDDVENCIRSSEFAQFLLSHTNEFNSAAFILQVLLNSLDAIYDAQEIDNFENN